MPKPIRLRAVALTVLLAASAAAAQTPAAPSKVAQIVPGSPFPAWTFANLNPAAGPAKVDLATVLGKQPVLFFYWIAGNARSEKVLQEVEALAKSAGGRLAVFAIASPPMGSSDVNPIRERLAEMNLEAAVTVLKRTVGASTADAVLARIRALRIRDNAFIQIDPPPPLGPRFTTEEFDHAYAERDRRPHRPSAILSYAR